MKSGLNGQMSRNFAIWMILMLNVLKIFVVFQMLHEQGYRLDSLPEALDLHFCRCMVSGLQIQDSFKHKFLVHLEIC